MTKEELKQAVLEAVKRHGGSADLIEVAKYIWANHEQDLRRAGDRFYRWQYEMRWAANELRREGKFASAEATPKGTWKLA